MNRDELRNDVRDEYPDENWDTECAGFAYLVCRLSGTVRRAYASATDARNASQIVSTDMAAAPAGAFHHWSYRTRLNGVYKDWGHVATALGGGRAVMTNPEHDEWDWGICLGETDVAAWTARRRGIVTYLGWSYTYGENTANITTETTAGGNARPFEEDDMYTDADRARDDLIAERLRGPHDRNIDMLQSIEGIVSLVLLRIRGPVERNYDMLQSIESIVSGQKPVELGADDQRAIAASIVAMLPSSLGNLDDGEVARIAKAVTDEQAKRLAR